MKKFFNTKEVLITVLIIVLAVVALLPVFWMVSSSLKVEGEIYRTSPTWIPESFTLEHYRDLFGKFNFQKYLLNSLIITVSTTIISVALGLPAAYGFSRYKFPGSKFILLVVLLIRVFTPAALVVPLYYLMSWLGLTDSLLSIIIGITIVNLPFTLWIMKVFFDGFPVELEEAAKVDGCSYLRIFTNIVLPCSLPAIATVVLFSFSAGWTDFLFGISFSQSDKSQPVTVAISNMLTGYKVYWGSMMAGGTFLSIPLIVLTLILQKYFIKGLTMGAIKE